MTNDEWAMMMTVCGGGGQLASTRRRRIVKRQQIQYPLRKIAPGSSALRYLPVGHKAVVEIAVPQPGFVESFAQKDVAAILRNEVN